MLLIVFLAVWFISDSFVFFHFKKVCFVSCVFLCAEYVVVDVVQTWQCEFCGTRNSVDILAEEIPSHPDVTYMISPAPVTEAASCQGDENSVVIFCIDVSGSMGDMVSWGCFCLFSLSSGDHPHNRPDRSYCSPVHFKEFLELHVKKKLLLHFPLCAIRSLLHLELKIVLIMLTKKSTNPF